MLLIKIIVTLLFMFNISITFFAVFFNLERHSTYTMSTEVMRKEALKQIIGTVILMFLIWFDLL